MLGDCWVDLGRSCRNLADFGILLVRFLWIFGDFVDFFGFVAPPPTPHTHPWRQSKFPSGGKSLDFFFNDFL